MTLAVQAVHMHLWRHGNRETIFPSSRHTTLSHRLLSCLTSAAAAAGWLVVALPLPDGSDAPRSASEVISSSSRCRLAFS